MGNICSVFMSQVSLFPQWSTCPLNQFYFHKLWIAILMRVESNPVWEYGYPAIKTTPHHGRTVCVVLNAALLPSEVCVVPICKLAQGEIWISRIWQCCLQMESNFADKRKSQMMEDYNLIVMADHGSDFLLFVLIKRDKPSVCKCPKICQWFGPIFCLVSSSASSSVHEVFEHVGVFMQRSVSLETALQSPGVVLHLRDNQKLQNHWKFNWHLL